MATSASGPYVAQATNVYPSDDEDVDDVLVPPSGDHAGIDSLDTEGLGVLFSRVAVDDATNRGNRRPKPQTLSEDIISNMNMQKVQETLREFATQMHPTQATVLRLLRQREEELRAGEIVSVVDAAKDKKKDKKKKHRKAYSESDTSSGSESGSDTEPILKPSKDGPRVVGTQPHYHGVQPVHYRPPLPFKGNKEEDWKEFKNKLIKMFRTLQLNDEQAADQFCTYLEGWAYKHWDGLAEEIQASFPKVIKAFDKKYSNDLEQDEWQMRYETMKYLGPEKETLDQLAGRIKDIVNKAYPDVTRKGVVYSRKEQRQSSARRKFWDLLPKDVRKQLFVHFGGCDAPLRQQLQYARRLEAAEMRTNQEDLPYDTICSAELYDDPTVALVNTTISDTTQQSEELEHQSGWRENYQSCCYVNSPFVTPQQMWPQPPQPQTWQLQPQQQVWQQPLPQQGWQQQLNWQGQNQQQTRPKPVCHNCGKIGHIRKHCQNNPADQQQQNNEGNQRQWTPNAQQQMPQQQNPQDIRDKQTPMDAMRIQKASQQPYNPKVASCEAEQEEATYPNPN